MKLTNKQVKEKYFTYAVGYCELQNLLRYENRTGYNSGINGWNSDFYIFGNKAISTGYNPIGKYISHKLVREYDDGARKIIQDDVLSWEDKREIIGALLADFVSKL